MIVIKDSTMYIHKKDLLLKHFNRDSEKNSILKRTRDVCFQETFLLCKNRIC